MATCKKSVDSKNPFGAGCVLETGHAGVHVGAQGERQDTDNTPTCKAQYTLNHGDPWDCVLSENHAGPHRDDDDDSWDITYRDVPGVSPQAITADGVPVYLARLGEEQGDYLHGRAHGELIKELYQRVSSLEQTSASGAASDDMFAVVNRRLGMLETAVLVHPEECRCLPCVMPSERVTWVPEPTVLATQTDGRQVMSDGSVRDAPEHECGPAC